MRRRAAAAAVALAVSLAVAAPADSAPLPDATVAARRHFFGAENVDAAGNLPKGRVILSWFSVSSFAAALDGHVVLLDTYIHKSEDRPGYVPTTTDELADLRPEVIFIGHGHFDHANTAGELAVRTGAPVVGTPEHCEQTTKQAGSFAGRPFPVRCIPAVERGSPPAAEIRRLMPLGPDVCVDVMKHVHSDAVPPDAEHRDPQLVPPPLPDASRILLHPPGPSTVTGLDAAGDEGGVLLYQFRIGRFALVWNDSAGPVREKSPKVLEVMKRLPPTDVHFNAVLGFNNPTNGARDPVDYLESIRPKVMFPEHHDFVAEYGAGDQFETFMRREMAARGDLGGVELRWLRDPYDYLRPALTTFDVNDARWAADGPARKRTFELHRIPGTRVVRVEAFVNGRRALRRRGRDIRSVTLPLRETGGLKVRIVATHSSGARVVSTRSYDACGKGKPRVRVVR